MTCLGQSPSKTKADYVLYDVLYRVLYDFALVTILRFFLHAYLLSTFYAYWGRFFIAIY